MPVSDNVAASAGAPEPAERPSATPAARVPLRVGIAWVFTVLIAATGAALIDTVDVAQYLGGTAQV